MKLSIVERVTLLGLLPKEGTFITLKVVQETRQRLAFNEAEIEAFKIKEIPISDGQVSIQFDPKSEPVELEFGVKATEIIKESLEKLDKSGKLTEREMSLYEKFVVSK